MDQISNDILPAILSHMGVVDVSHLSMSSKIMREKVRISIIEIGVEPGKIPLRVPIIEFFNWFGLFKELKEGKITLEQLYPRLIVIKEIVLYGQTRYIVPVIHRWSCSYIITSNITVARCDTIIKQMALFCSKYSNLFTSVRIISGDKPTKRDIRNEFCINLIYDNGEFRHNLTGSFWRLDNKNALTITGTLHITTMKNFKLLAPYIRSIRIRKEACDAIAFTLLINLEVLMVDGLACLRLNDITLPASIKVLRIRGIPPTMGLPCIKRIHDKYNLRIEGDPLSVSTAGRYDIYKRDMLKLGVTIYDHS